MDSRERTWGFRREIDTRKTSFSKVRRKVETSKEQNQGLGAPRPRRSNGTRTVKTQKRRGLVGNETLGLLVGVGYRGRPRRWSRRPPLTRPVYKGRGEETPRSSFHDRGFGTAVVLAEVRPVRGFHTGPTSLGPSNRTPPETTGVGSAKTPSTLAKESFLRPTTAPEKEGSRERVRRNRPGRVVTPSTVPSVTRNETRRHSTCPDLSPDPGWTASGGRIDAGSEPRLAGLWGKDRRRGTHLRGDQEDLRHGRRRYSLVKGGYPSPLGWTWGPGSTRVYVSFGWVAPFRAEPPSFLHHLDPHQAGVRGTRRPTDEVRPGPTYPQRFRPQSDYLSR